MSGRDDNASAFSNFTPGANDINATSDGGINFTALNNILDAGSLKDNGGDTETLALASDSPAIDAGNNNENLSYFQKKTLTFSDEMNFGQGLSIL